MTAFPTLPGSPAALGKRPPATGAPARLRLALDPLRTALALLIVLNISRVHQHFPALAALRPALLLVVLSLLYVFLNPRSCTLTAFTKTWEPKLILGLAALAVCGAPFGLSLGGSWKFILDSYWKVILAALLVVVAIRSTRDLRTFTWAYAIGCGILGFFSIFVFKMSQSAGSVVTRLNDLYMYDANDIGVVLLAGLGLTFLLFHTSSGAGRLLAAAIIIGIMVSVARSGSRGALVGLLATGVAMVLMLRTVALWKRMLFLGVTLASLLLAAPPGYWKQMATLFDLSSDYNVTTIDGRKELTKRGVSYMLSYPVFGLGIGNFWRAECLVPVSDKVRFHRPGTGIRCSPPHNTHVEAGAELGLPGLALFWMLVFGGIRRGLNLRRKLPGRWLQGDHEERFLYMATLYIPAAMVAFAVTSTFVTFAWLDIVYLIAALLAGLQVSVRRRLGSPGLPAVPSPAPAVRTRNWRGTAASRPAAVMRHR